MENSQHDDDAQEQGLGRGNPPSQPATQAAEGAAGVVPHRIGTTKSLLPTYKLGWEVDLDTDEQSAADSFEAGEAAQGDGKAPPLIAEQQQQQGGKEEAADHHVIIIKQNGGGGGDGDGGDKVLLEKPAAQMLKAKPLDRSSLWRALTPLQRCINSMEVKLSAQLVAGALVAMLFVLVDPLRFPLSFLAPILYLVPMVLLSQATPYWGGKLYAAASTIGYSAFSTPFGGSTVSLARVLPGAFVPWLCFLACVGLALIAVVRSLTTPQGQSAGLLSGLVYGVAVISFEYTWPARVLWKNVGWLVLATCIAGGSAAFAATLVFPLPASRGLRDTLAKVLVRLGLGVSEYGSQLFLLDDDTQQRQYAGMVRWSSRHEPADDEFLDTLRSLSTPEQLRKDRSPSSAFHVATLRPDVAKAQLALGIAAMEPPWVDGIYNLSEWNPAVNKLITTVTALEMVLEGGRHFHTRTLLKWFHEDEIPLIRYLYADMAAVCAGLAFIVRGDANRTGFSPLCRVKRVAWQRYVDVHTAGLKAAFDRYWAQVLKEDGQVIAPTSEVRALIFTAIVTHQIIIDLQELESAVKKAVKNSHYQPLDKEGATLWQKVQHWLKANFSFVVPHAKALSCYALIERWFTVFFHHLPKNLKSSESFKRTLRSRNFQFGCKWWLCTATVVVVVLSIQHIHTVSDWKPLWAYFCVVLTIFPKVDTTVLRALLRIIATIIAAAIAYGLMSNVDIASEPIVLGAILSVITFVMGLFLSTQFMYAVFLFIITLYTLTLQQYTPQPGDTGNWKWAVARPLEMTIGAVFAILVSNLILPWYASDEALETLAQTLEKGQNTVDIFHDEFNSIGAEVNEPAVASDKHDREPPPPPPEWKNFSVQSALIAPLSAVQLILAREAVMWKRGPLAMPPIVAQTLAGMLVLSDRLAAMAIVNKRPPIITGRQVQGMYNGDLHRFLTGPLEPQFAEVSRAAERMVKTAVDMLRSVEHTHESVSKKDIKARASAGIHELEAARLELRRQYLERRKLLHACVKCHPKFTDMPLHNYDDAALVLSWIYTYSKAMDRLTMVVRIITGADS
eukprot:jgi/Chlat1/87/Chrsp1S00219